VQIYMKFCVRGHLADIINRAEFYLNRIRGFDSVGGRIFGLSHRKEKSPLTQGLNYCSACDVGGKIRRLAFFLTQLHLVYDAEIAHNITAHLKCHFFIYVRCVLQ